MGAGLGEIQITLLNRPFITGSFVRRVRRCDGTSAGLPELAGGGVSR